MPVSYPTSMILNLLSLKSRETNFGIFLSKNLGVTLSAKFTVIYLPNFPFTTIIWTFSFYDTFIL